MTFHNNSMRAARGFLRSQLKKLIISYLYITKKGKNKCTKLSTNQTAYKKMVPRNKDGVMHAISIHSNLTKAPIFAYEAIINPQSSDLNFKITIINSTNMKFPI